jgi:nitrite reductase/ring-hydroxylating ferredoxin subunit/uncharacterized membrane protein
MRSRAQFRGHPIHPMLIPFPIAFLVGALIADLGALVLDWPDLALVAWYLIPAGVGMGLVAAIPGFIDYVYTVPPASSGKKRATRHLMVNVAALVVFSIAWLLRGSPGVEPEPALLGVEMIGAILLTMGGWMGGTLAYRNQIGVDHRYARAGKWSESKVPEDRHEWVTVARVDELEVDQMKLLRVGDRRLVLARTEEEWVAFEDRCTHRGGSLAGGMVVCGTVTCPWHGSQFDTRTGRVAAGPAEEPIAVYPVEVKGEEVRLDLSR